ncbi:hypothetical protein Z950_1664 [Sulfitobacter mediterraneus KCTC 32188]|nr:hypothetical protein Z950_1664 [Sulfitobacter mediterraneus KCTC 32188]
MLLNGDESGLSENIQMPASSGLSDCNFLCNHGHAHAESNWVS